jgi:inositol-pentakisphosphate 2-kinase
MKSSKIGDAGEGEGMRLRFCPLSLVSGDRGRVTTAVDMILGLSRSGPGDHGHVREALIEFLLESSLLRRLKDLQIELDPIGVLAADVSGRPFLTAMTLRDCTLFLKV